LFLWLRYLRKRRIVLLSIAAVALSVSLLVVVTSLFTGFIEAYQRIAVEFLGDMVLEPPARVSRYPVLIERLEKLGAVEAATATLSAQGILFLGKGNVRAVLAQGIEPAGNVKVTALKRSLIEQGHLPGPPSFAVEGKADSVGGFVGIAAIKEPDEETDEYDLVAAREMLGRQVVLTTGSVLESQESGGSGAGSRLKRQVVKFIVTDIVHTGFYDLDKRYVFLPIDCLQRALYPGRAEPLAELIQIKLARNVSIESAKAQILGVWYGFVDDYLDGDPYMKNYADVQTAVEMQGRYMKEVRKQMGLLLVIFGVVSFSVVVLVFCIFYMIVTTRRRDIAIIKSCGTASRSVACIFVGFGLCVGIIGSVLGALLGFLITKNVNVLEGWIRVIFGLKLWKSGVYMFSKIPEQVSWPWTVPIVVSAVVAAGVGALVPAIVAARTRPVDILRYE